MGPVILAFECDLDMVERNQRAKYLGRRSLTEHTDTHTGPIDLRGSRDDASPGWGKGGNVVFAGKHCVIPNLNKKLCYGRETARCACQKNCRRPNRPILQIIQGECSDQDGPKSPM